jgi:UDP-N-acetylmuramoyl-L-alanyl-D-glutamate--2,6-diaminopimelate ligase
VATGPVRVERPAFHAEIDSVGVTGTNGKTTTTTFIAAALRALGEPVARVTTLGFFLDDAPVELPLDWGGFVEGFARLRERGGRRAAIEFTSHTLARGMAAAWPCRVAVFTNFTRDHLDHHGTPEHYLASKAQLFAALPDGGVAVLNAADPASALLREVVPVGATVRSYAVPSRGAAVFEPDLVATHVEIGWEGTRVVADGAESLELRVRGIGEHFAENALAAYLACRGAGVPRDAVVAALADAEVPKGRFEVVARAPFVVVDYAHTPDALDRTLRAARRLAMGRVTLVFGAGGDRDVAKRPLMGAAARGADRVVLTSDNPRTEDPARIAEGIQAGLADHRDVRVELDRAHAIALAIREAATDDVVILAGKGHEETQIVGHVAHAFSDRDVAQRALAAR